MRITRGTLGGEIYHWIIRSDQRRCSWWAAFIMIAVVQLAVAVVVVVQLNIAPVCLVLLIRRTGAI